MRTSLSDVLDRLREDLEPERRDQLGRLALEDPTIFVIEVLDLLGRGLVVLTVAEERALRAVLENGA